MIEERPRCACGLPMIELHVKGTFACGNCDFPQPRETQLGPDGEPYKRIKTPEDIEFHKEWKRRINDTFTGKASETGIDPAIESE